MNARRYRYGRQAWIAISIPAAVVVFLLAFWLGWATDDEPPPLARAVPLSARPTAVAIVRLRPAAELPGLRPVVRPRSRARTTTSAARASRPKQTPKPTAPRPVTIDGSG